MVTFFKDFTKMSSEGYPCTEGYACTVIHTFFAENFFENILLPGLFLAAHWGPSPLKMCINVQNLTIFAVNIPYSCMKVRGLTLEFYPVSKWTRIKIQV